MPSHSVKQAKGPSSKQVEKMGLACAEALVRYNASRIRISDEERNKRHRERGPDLRYKTRLEMIDAYGGVCVKCGEPDPIVLLLDHIYDDALWDKKQNGHHGGWVMYRKLKKLGWPKDRYQLLCHNCNYRKEYNRRRLKFHHTQ